jgi:hypothetical protein
MNAPIAFLAPKLVITREKPARQRRLQTERDWERCIERRRGVEPLFIPMSKLLTRLGGGRLTRSVLSHVAEEISKQKTITIDRNARRIKDAMICWICENAPELLTQGGLSPAVSTKPDNLGRLELNPLDAPEFDDLWLDSTPLNYN